MAMDGKVKNKLIPQNIVLIRNNGINIKSVRSGALKLNELNAEYLGFIAAKAKLTY